MPGLVQRGRKRPSLALSDDDDEHSDHSSAVSVGSKRARHARDASDNQIATHRGLARSQASSASEPTIHDPDDFQPGSLIRVKLKNFVTYTAAEFHLGPSLNMVIGPNGTGKSTLVCAICLGLGWGSEHLGRAKELGAFVKHGASEATIEIELAAGPGMETNPIVRRTIRKEDNKSQFVLNGKVVPQKAITTMCKGLSIQIDNLCQFLPQDRVVEFAKMTDVDRLRETQRAAAPAHMVEWHDQLKVLRSEEKKSEIQQQNERGHLERLEKSQNSAREDVERWHQREGLLQKARCLKKVKPIIEMRLRKNELLQAKADLRAARLDLDRVNAEIEPVRQAQEEAQAYQNQVQRVVDGRKDRLNNVKKIADGFMARINADKQTISDSVDQVQGEANAKKNRDKDIARLKNVISDLERRRNEQAVDYDAAFYETSKAELRAQISTASQQLSEKKASHTTLKSRARELHETYQTTKRQRQALDTQIGQQASLLSKVSRDTAAAWDWFQKNRHSLPLRGEVYGPPILECSIPEAKYVQAVESQFRKGDAIAITCTNGADQQLLSAKFFGRGQDSIGLHDVHLRTSPKPLSSYVPQVAKNDLSQYGFENYLLDFIKGPDAVLAMLCDNVRLNQVAFASRSLSDEQYAAVERTRIRSWVSGTEIYRITVRAEYNARSTQVSQLRKARFFADQPVDVEEKRQLDDALKEVQRDAEELRGHKDALEDEMRALEGQIEELKQTRTNIQDEQDRLKKALAEWGDLPNKIARKQSELAAIEQQNAETSSRIREIKSSARDASLHMAGVTLEYTKTVAQLRICHESLVEAEIRAIEAGSELNALVVENREILDKQKTKEQELKELDQRNKRLRAEYKKIQETTQGEIDALPEEEKKILVEYRTLPSLQALDQEVAAVDARLDMMSEGNPGAIRAYEKREEEIRKTREKLEELTASLTTTKESIVEIREQWEPELDALISKISDAFAHNFQQIGCAGEVAVYKDEEDFDNWSVQISVRFREGEQLSVLNANRQSGGERAVSTIFYLMALQDLAQSPFRVVDEINQGMDPRNERMVHERMVDIACQERTSQYFLITPKLLTGLKFHPKMKVHVINSGEHIPDSKTVKGGWDLKDMARIALRTRKGIEVA